MVFSEINKNKDTKLKSGEILNINFRTKKEGLLFTALGLISGSVGVLTGINGPPIVFGLVNQQYDATFIRRCLITYLIVIDIVTLASFSISGYVTVDLLLLLSGEVETDYTLYNSFRGSYCNLEFLTVEVGAFLWIYMKIAGGITGAGDHMTECKRTGHIMKNSVMRLRVLFDFFLVLFGSHAIFRIHVKSYLKGNM